MIQFVDQINSKQGFVDLHIHTDESYGDEMGKMHLSPEDLLESIYLYTDKNNCPATFSVTDHNSILAVEKIEMLMKANPTKYKRIKFISGCEFSCSAGSLGTITKPNGHIKNIFHNFHLLAYNFNPNNPALIFLTKLHSNKPENSIFNGTKKISAGSYIIALKNILKDHGKNIPLKNFSNLSLTTENISQTDFIKYLMTFVDKYKLSEEVKKDIFYQLSCRNILSLGKLDVMDVMEIVEGAGGYCVLAHPYLLEFSTTAKKNRSKYVNFIKIQLKKMGVAFDDKESEKSIIIKFFASFLKRNCVSLYDDTKELKGIVGIEMLHTSSTYKFDTLMSILSCIENEKLYITCGSDSHGDFNKLSFLSLFLQTSMLDDPHINNIVVTDNLFAKNILNGQIKKNIDCEVPFNEQIRIIKTLDNGLVKEIQVKDISEMIAKKIVKTNERITKNKEFKEREFKELEKDTLKTLKKIRKESTPEEIKIIQKGIANFRSLNNLLENLLENYQLGRATIIEEYEKLRTIYKVPILNSLTFLDENYDTMKEEKNSLKLIDELCKFKSIDEEFKTNINYDDNENGYAFKNLDSFNF